VYHVPGFSSIGRSGVYARCARRLRHGEVNTRCSRLFIPFCLPRRKVKPLRLAGFASGDPAVVPPVARRIGTSVASSALVGGSVQAMTPEAAAASSAALPPCCPPSAPLRVNERSPQRCCQPHHYYLPLSILSYIYGALGFVVCARRPGLPPQHLSGAVFRQ
jgi:hypothetical protein